MQQRLVKAGLIFFRYDKHIALVVELLLGLALGDVITVTVHVHAAFGVFVTAFLFGVADASGECDKDFYVIIVVGI